MCPSDSVSMREDVPGVGKQMYRSYALTDKLADAPNSSSSVLLVEEFSITQAKAIYNVDNDNIALCGPKDPLPQ